MTADELILELMGKGVKLIPQADGALDVDAPDGTLTPELIAALRQHKRVILRRMAMVERGEAEPIHRHLGRLFGAERARENEHVSQIK